MVSLLAVLLLCLISYMGADLLGFQALFGIWIPYLGVFIFIIGFVIRVMGWAKSPVPFRIPTTCGQQKTLNWIEPNAIDNPTSKGGVLVRMILEILLFRSLFRNTSMAFNNTETGPKITYRMEIWLWVAALAFHYAFLTVFVRHLRFFFEPVPLLIQIVENLDSFFRIEYFSSVIEVGLPSVYMSGLVLLAAVTFLLLRRMFDPKVKHVSLAADYFPLFLIIGIALTGILMRYFSKVDIVAIKELAISLVTLNPAVPEGIGGLFFIHVFLVSVLFAYFPFSKLMHMGGIFLSPTRNLTTDTRAKRHVNPWNYPVKIHTYAEYEDHFREKMIEAGLPVEKE
jgi:nitrate reductase gamma subunit